MRARRYLFSWAEMNEPLIELIIRSTRRRPINLFTINYYTTVFHHSSWNPTTKDQRWFMPNVNENVRNQFFFQIKIDQWPSSLSTHWRNPAIRAQLVDMDPGLSILGFLKRVVRNRKESQVFVRYRKETYGSVRNRKE